MANIEDTSRRLVLKEGSTTLTLELGTTATMEKVAPSGFQQRVQPQTWLWAHWPEIFTLT